MKSYEFKCGVVVGRFSPLHIGHERIIKLALERCEEVVIIVTSNDKIDDKNPYSLEYRIYLIKKVFSKFISDKRLKIATITGDRKIDKSYGNYILKIVKEVSGKEADFIVYGNDKDIEKCFSKEAIKSINRLQVDRKEVDISATKIRKALKKHDFEFLNKYLNPLVYEEIEILKNI